MQKVIIIMLKDSKYPEQSGMDKEIRVSRTLQHPYPIDYTIPLSSFSSPRHTRRQLMRNAPISMLIPIQLRADRIILHLNRVRRRILFLDR
jgi:hypothetical protein